MKKYYISLLLMIFFTSTVFSQVMTDVDGNDYSTKSLSGNVWTVEDANMDKYSDGTLIPQVTDTVKWGKLTTGAWCYVDNDSSKGKLYNAYALAKLAPKGWHVATKEEWSTLEEYTAVSLASGEGWKKSDTGTTPGNRMANNNETGFNAYPSGERWTIASGGIFFNEGSMASYWTSTVDSGDLSGWVTLYYYHIGSDAVALGSNTDIGVAGKSVRFVKD